MNENISINKEVLVAMQHQMLMYLTVVANLTQVETLKPTMDAIVGMFLNQIPLTEAEKVVDDILKSPDEYVNNWNTSVTELKKYHTQASQMGNSETREIEVPPIINE